jgi:hypothetical protein
MDRKLFFVGFLFPELTSQSLRVLKFGLHPTLDGLKTGKWRWCIGGSCGTPPAPGFGPVLGGYHLLVISVGQDIHLFFSFG